MTHHIPRETGDYREYDSIKETDTKHVYRLVTIDDVCHYRFDYQDGSFSETEFDSEEAAGLALAEYFNWLEGQNQPQTTERQ